MRFNQLKPTIFAFLPCTVKPRRTLNRCRRNAIKVSPMTSGPGPTKSQKTGWSLNAETIVPRRTREKANPKPLMSPVVQFSLIALFIESRWKYRPSITPLLSGSCAACRSFAEKKEPEELQNSQKKRKDLTADECRYTQIGISQRIAKATRRPALEIVCLCGLLLSSCFCFLSVGLHLRSYAVLVFCSFAAIPSCFSIFRSWV